MMRKEKAAEIYNYVFDKMYNHLDVNMKDGSLRKNFKELKIIDDKE